MNLPLSLIRLAARLTLAVSSLSLLSCASAKLDYQDPGHAATGFKTGSIAIAGLVQSGGDGSISEWDRNAVANEFGRAIGKKRRGVSVIAWERFKGSVGKPSSRVSSGSDVLRGALSSSQIAKARKSGATYALFIEVSGNETWCDVDESRSTDTEEIKDEHGHVISCITTTTYTTSSRSHRRVKARYFLYELSSGKKVWVTSSEHGEVHSRSACSECCYPPPPAHPEPPSVSDVMKNMSAAAIRKLPRK